MRKIIQAAALIMALFPSTLLAQDFAAGLQAYAAGDYETALKEWRPLAEQGGAAAQYNLGVMYDNGEGVAQDDVEAVKWYRLAAKQGQGVAQNNLGLMYSKGKGVAQNNLGLMYSKGKGVAQNYVEAVKWYKLAAKQGYALAQYNLGVMYDNGEGVAQDYVRAHMWANIAAANGGENAQELREYVARKMAPTDIATAQQMAGACLESGYKNCGF